MTINTHVSIKSFFYPIGNTPAVNLLRDSYSRPDACIKILCVACGDVRNVLFTLWSAGPPSQRRYEFTTNDCEPAVLARNVLLFSFLIDQATTSIGSKVIWEIYYHLFITKDALVTLRTKSAKLLQVSTSITDWHRSPYGKHLVFLDNNTLSMLRRYWQLYQNSRDFSKEYHKSVGKMGQHAKGGLVMQGVRSAGVHMISSAEAMSASIKGYWEYGVVAGNKHDLQTLQKSKPRCDNPTFAHSSAAYGNFAVHRGTDPLSGFHLAEAFDVKKESSKMIETLASLAKSQFQSWCENWKAYIKNDSVVISFCCAEAVGFCYALQEKVIGRSGLSQAHRPYQLPWSSQILRFEETEVARAYELYDIIDTSNLSDNLGTLNLLPAVVPLLRKVASSTLYIETLLQDSGDMTLYFDEQLHTDLASISVIAGVVPTCTILGTSTEHYGTEMLLDQLKSRSSSTQFRCRVAWQKAFGGDQRIVGLGQQDLPSTNVDAHELAAFFVEWYTRIFAGFEDMGCMFSKMLQKPQSVRTITFNRYTRTTLISLLSLAKANVITNWYQCIDAFLEGVEQNRSLLVGSSFLQELYVLLHLSGLYTVPSMTRNPQAVLAELSSGATPVLPPCMTGFPVLPKVVYVALTIPRKKLKVFTSTNPDEIGNPILRLIVFEKGGFENGFLNIRTCFGKLSFHADDNTATIDESPFGWSGESDLIVIAAMQTASLLLGDVKKVRVGLGIQPLSGSPQFIRSLGMHMSVYDTSIDNPKNVRILSTLPGTGRASTQAPNELSGRTGLQSQSHTVSLQNRSLNVLTVRASIVDDAQRRSLKDGCQLASSQESPCTVTVKFSSHSHVFYFNSPVNSARCKTKVSRKDLWIEVTVPISLAAQPNGYADDPFPIVSHSKTLSAWGTSRVNLDRQAIVPTVPMPDLGTFLTMTLSKAEAATGSPQETSSMCGFKWSLVLFFLSFMGQHPSAPNESIKFFRLVCAGECDLLIFANALRHDSDSGSICIDAHVVPATRSLFRRMSSLFPPEVHGVVDLKVSRGGEVLWKRALPAFVERCRVGWEHGPECEYLVNHTNGFVCPRSIRHGATPICSCGEGKDVAGLPESFKGVAPHATRVAIAPVSAVPFVEPLAVQPGPGTESFGQLGAPSESSTASNATTWKVVDGEGKDICSHCGGGGGDSGELKACGGCRKVKYCGRDCQKAAWKEHKVMCLASKE